MFKNGRTTFSGVVLPITLFLLIISVATDTASMPTHAVITIVVITVTVVQGAVAMNADTVESSAIINRKVIAFEGFCVFHNLFFL